MPEIDFVFLNETNFAVKTELVRQQLTETWTRLQPQQQIGRLITEIVFVGDEKIKALNAQYRGVNTPTDVLSFERPEGVADVPASVVISVETASRQAKTAGWSVDQELNSLANHGFLHILGYSHS